jgi:hypothetical protein
MGKCPRGGCAICQQAHGTHRRVYSNPGDAGHRSRRYCVHEMRGMNVNDTELVLDALAHESWLYTASGANTLQQRLRAATGRSIAESTINDAVRAMNWTSKEARR